MNKEKIEEIIKNLPEGIKQLVTSPEVYERLLPIKEKFNLHIDQLGELDSEVRFVMIGVHKSIDFRKNIEERLEISTSDAIEITNEVNTTVFPLMKEALKKIYPSTDASEKEEKIQKQEPQRVWPLEKDSMPPIGNSWKKITPVPEAEPAPTVTPLPATPLRTAIPTPPTKPFSRPEPVRVAVPHTPAAAPFNLPTRQQETQQPPATKKTPGPSAQNQDKNVEMRGTDYRIEKDVFSSSSWKRVDPATLDNRGVDSLIKPAEPVQNVEKKNEPVHLANVREILSHAHVLRAIENPETIPTTYPHSREETVTAPEEDVPHTNILPVIAPEHELMVEPGETAHDVPRAEEPAHAGRPETSLPLQPLSEPSKPLDPPLQTPNYTDVPPSFTDPLPSFFNAPVENFFPEPDFRVPQPQITEEFTASNQLPKNREEQQTPPTPAPNPSTSNNAPVPTPAPSAPTSIPTPPVATVPPSPQPTDSLMDRMLHGRISIGKQETTKDESVKNKQEVTAYKTDPYRESF